MLHTIILHAKKTKFYMLPW